MKKMRFSMAERISLAISLVGTTLSAFSFFHSPTVVAKVPPLTVCHESSRNPPQSSNSASSQSCYPDQRNSETPLIYAKLREISHRLDKLEATHQEQSKSSSTQSLYSEPKPSTLSTQKLLNLPQFTSGNLEKLTY